ncbi:hypothetical protein GN958_ATG03923 [Phytophthora infestans]|uniref:Uncharacterized protein n=1 Tax=Phytophthora infestans TaxID=4787 RepID=A0A8S9V1S9_PHYIN|nr:hypothetical protein GN958_ATG03923 [Phytophthora infestans]
MSNDDIGKTVNAIRRMLDSAIFNPPKAFITEDSLPQPIETDIRFVLRDMCVADCFGDDCVSRSY